MVLVMSSHLKKNKDTYTLDAFDVRNHSTILQRYPRAKLHYENATKDATEKAEAQSRQFDELDKFRALVWAVSMSRQEMVLDDGNKHFVELMSFMEGNNCMGAAIMMMFNSAYE